MKKHIYKKASTLVEATRNTPLKALIGASIVCIATLALPLALSFHGMPDGIAAAFGAVFALTFSCYGEIERAAR